MDKNNLHIEYMKLAINLAISDKNEVPVGALIIKNGVIIAESSNKKELTKNPTAHAEMIVIQEACKKLDTSNLSDCSLYVTLEPCPMCASAILHSKISNIYFGAYDNLYGAFGSALDMRNYIKFNPTITGGILELECRNIIKIFFKNLR